MSVSLTGTPIAIPNGTPRGPLLPMPGSNPPALQPAPVNNNNQIVGTTAGTRSNTVMAVAPVTDSASSVMSNITPSSLQIAFHAPSGLNVSGIQDTAQPAAPGAGAMAQPVANASLIFVAAAVVGILVGLKQLFG